MFLAANSQIMENLRISGFFITLFAVNNWL